MSNITKFIVCALLSATFLASCSSGPRAIELFNGRDLDGWKGYLVDSSLDTDKEFIVRDGVIRLSGALGYIHTEKIYSDYKLEVEWRWPEEATNSGIFVRTQSEYKALPEGFECQLKVGDAGILFGLDGASTAETRVSGGNMAPRINPSNEKPVGEWNRAEITCKGGDITVVINGEVQNRVTGASLTEGYIGLQSEGGAIEFRGVRLTSLD